MSKVLIVGGGAAGMLASIFAARNGHEVHVYEKNEKLGKKLYITGKGRCNLTNACDMDALFASVRTNSRFLYSAFYGFTNQDAMAFFRRGGSENQDGAGRACLPLVGQIGGCAGYPAAQYAACGRGDTPEYRGEEI